MNRLFFGFLSLLIVSCTGGQGDLAFRSTGSISAFPELVMTSSSDACVQLPESLECSLGEVYFRTQQSFSVTIKNTGGRNFSGLEFSGDMGKSLLTIENGCQLELAPLTSCTVTFHIDPMVVGETRKTLLMGLSNQAQFAAFTRSLALISANVLPINISWNAFANNAAPKILSVSPSSVPVAGNKKIAIKGENFLAGSIVKVGDTDCNNVIIENANQISCLVPAKSEGKTSITVILPDSQSDTLLNAIQYRTPALLSVSRTNVSFGAQLLQHEALSTVTLSNSSSSEGLIKAVSISAPFYQKSSTCSGALAPLSSCAIVIGFKPSSVIEVSGILNIEFDDSTDVVSRSLTLTGKGDNGIFNVGAGFDGAVNAIAATKDNSNSILVIGLFSTYKGQNSKHVAKIRFDGSLDTSFNPGSGFLLGTSNPQLLDVQVDSQNRVYVAGAFSSYKGTAVNSIARLLPNGDLDTSFNVGDTATGCRISPNGVVGTGTGRVLQLLADQSGIYLAGDCTSFNGNQIGNIVLLKTSDGSADFTRFDSKRFGATNTGGGVSWNATVLQLENDGSGSMYIGGQFTPKLGKLLSTAYSDISFTPAGLSGTPTALSLSQDGTGDTFWAAAFGITRLKRDGSMRSSFDIGTGFNARVRNILPLTDGSEDIIVTGEFTSFSDYGVANRIVRMDKNGRAKNDFQLGSGFDLEASKLMYAPDGSGDIYVVGKFSTYKGISSPRIIRITSEGISDSL